MFLLKASKKKGQARWKKTLKQLNLSVSSLSLSRYLYQNKNSFKFFPGSKKLLLHRKKKKPFRHVPFFNNHLVLKNRYYIIVAIRNNLSTLNIIRDYLGFIHVVPGTCGVFFGELLNYTLKNLIMNRRKLFGLRVPLFYTTTGKIISNLSTPLKGCFASASGVFSLVLAMYSEENSLLIRLPSGKKKFFTLTSVATLGRASNIDSKYQIKGGAGESNKLGKRPITRGVAMNPVDHPHGGRTKTNKPEKSIWGWIAKRNH